MTDHLSPATARYILGNLDEVERLLARAASDASASICFDIGQARLCNDFVRRAVRPMDPETTDV